MNHLKRKKQTLEYKQLHNNLKKEGSSLEGTVHFMLHALDADEECFVTPCVNYQEM